MREEIEKEHDLSEELKLLRAKIAELEATGTELRELEDRFNTFTRDSAYGYYELDLNGFITFANRRASEISGYSPEELVGSHIRDLLDEEDFARAPADLQEALTSLNTGIREYRIRSRDGEIRFIESNAVPFKRNGVPVGFQCTSSDVTDRKRAEEERRRLEEERRQSQKLEAIGTLAGGVAHDFNNILTGILAYANMLKRGSDPTEKVKRSAEIIERAARRGAELTGQLLSFARKGKLQNLPVDINMAIEDVVAILARTIDKRIEIEKDLRASPSHVLGDPGQIQQVALNLAVNARDAMPEGGRLLFETELVRFDEDGARAHGGLAAGGYVVMTVSDTGAGIPEDVRGQIFEPFFTTKGKQGTGMGLSVVYGIVKNHGGEIEVDSEPGRGTTFRVHLPAAGGRGRPKTEAVPAAPAEGKGHVLLVDDEEIVRTATREMLADLGYEVTTASDGLEAVETYRCRGGDVDLVMMDLVMPRMGGRDCFRALKEINPHVRVIATTGSGFEGVARELMDEGALGFVRKPYSSAELSEAIAKVISSDPGA